MNINSAVYKKKSISVIFPVHNEAESIQKVLLEWIKELNKHPIKYEIIICEDGSTDGTSELLKNIRPKYKFTLNQKRRRRGYGGAVLDGIKSAKFNMILCVDSDGQCNPSDLRNILKESDKADVIKGWRVTRSDVKSRLFYSKYFNVLFNLLFPSEIKDPSAPYVLFKRNTFLPLFPYLKLLKEGFWWGFVAVCIKKNINIKEIPIDHRARYDGDTKVYKLRNIFNIAVGNIFGLFKLWLAK